MRILLWAEFQKLRRSNIIMFTIFATILIAVIVFVSGVTTVSDNQLTTSTVGWYMTITQVWATMFVLPAVIALLGSYMICREEQDNTLKSLRLIPVNETKLTTAKMIVALVFSMLVYLLLFVITFMTEVILHFSDLSMVVFVEFLKMYLLEYWCIFCRFPYYCNRAISKEKLLVSSSFSRNLFICRTIYEYVKYCENFLSYHSNIWYFWVLRNNYSELYL